MAQVTLTDKGIGPIPYDGYNYWVAPSSDRILSSWISNKVNINGISYEIPIIEELNNVIYKNREEIDEVDTTIGGSSSPSLANIVAGTARDGSNSQETTWVWSSKEFRSLLAWVQRFSDGSIGYGNVTYEGWVVGIYKEPIA